MTEQADVAPLAPEQAARLAEFARACKAAARAVALYPGGHPAIRSSLARLVEASARATAGGAFDLQVLPDRLLVGGAAPARPDPAIAELAELLHRHLIGGLTLRGGIDEESWQTLLLLLARAPDDVRAEGGIGRLWTAGGGPSLEIREVDYAEVLRDRAGTAATIEQVIAACLKGTLRLDLDEAAMRELLRLAADPAHLAELMTRLEQATGGGAPQAAAFLRLLRGVAEFAATTRPGELEAVFGNMAGAAGRLSADTMAALLAQRDRPEALAAGVNVVGAVVDRMEDETIAGFVASSVVAERGATERLAMAFQALVPDVDRQRQILSLAGQQVAESQMGGDESFEDLWRSVESMLVSYSDERYVPADYARELSETGTQAVEVERVSDDPPERMAAWLATVSDAALRSLDLQLLLDLLTIEERPARWRDLAETVVDHIGHLARVDQLDAACRLAAALAEQATAAESERQAAALAAAKRLSRGPALRHIIEHLAVCDEPTCGRITRLCHALGPAVIGTLAEALAADEGARARRRLRDILLGFGPRGREAVQQLLQAANWEVRRTAAYLLREFGGIEGLPALEPLLTDREPLVQREALRAIVLAGDDRAYEALIRVLHEGPREARATLAQEIAHLRDERAAPLFCYLTRRLDRRALHGLYIRTLDALGTAGGEDAIEALRDALYRGDWWAPFRTRAARSAAASALRRTGAAPALDTLREAADRGPRGVRAAARAELGRAVAEARSPVEPSL